MTWLATPRGNRLHIPAPGARLIRGPDGVRLATLCTAAPGISDPHPNPWVWKPDGRPVCQTCANTARRLAGRLIDAAEGRTS